MITEIKIDGEKYSFESHGEFSWGNDELLFNPEKDLLANSQISESGYVLFQLLTSKEVADFKDKVLEALNRILKEVITTGNNHLDRLEDYHTVVLNSDIHKQVVMKTRDFRFNDLNLNPRDIEKRVGDFFGLKVNAIIKKLNRDHVQLRINRPSSLDINPPHRDAYLEAYKTTLNVWLPICGCNDRSSLPILPKSHLLNEKDIYLTKPGQGKIGSNTYSVPVIASIKNGIEMIRPNPKEGEVILFTPFLIHGAAFNKNPFTRMALEFRLEIEGQEY